MGNNFHNLMTVDAIRAYHFGYVMMVCVCEGVCVRV